MTPTHIHTYEEAATDWNLWIEFVDSDTDKDEFDRMTVAEKVALQIEAFGPESK